MKYIILLFSYGMVNDILIWEPSRSRSLLVPVNQNFRFLTEDQCERIRIKITMNGVDKHFCCSMAYHGAEARLEERGMARDGNGLVNN